jgi:hypothetical protein
MRIILNTMLANPREKINSAFSELTLVLRWTFIEMTSGGFVRTLINPLEKETLHRGAGTFPEVPLLKGWHFGERPQIDRAGSF